MHKIVKNSLCLALLISCSTGFAVAPYYSIRSQSENAARELVGAGWNTQINLCNMDAWYGNFSITPEYTRSFRPYRIAQCLFGCSNNGCEPCGTTYDSSCNPCDTLCDPCCDDCYRIKISGSQVNNRHSNDWLADHFGLPTDYQSCVTFEPHIDNVLIDFNFYLGLDKWCKGMYFRIHAPVVHTKWNLKMCECMVSTGTNFHRPGYFNETLEYVDTTTIGIARSNLISSFTSFISNCGTINSPDITFTPLCYAKMDCFNRKETALSDFQIAFGWNFWCEEDYHIGLNLRATAPTGNRPNATYLFEPIIGNGKHWELGGSLASHWTFWQSENEDRSCTFYIDANVTHMFKARQCRTFDLCGKPLSRYMRTGKFKTPVENLSAAVPDGDGTTATPPSKQFSGTYSPLANLTTLAVDVSIGAQTDLAFMLQYIHNKWSFDIGYNFWKRGCERIKCHRNCECQFEENTWGLLGDAFMYGFVSNGELNTPGIALSATQSKSTICNGTNNYPEGNAYEALLYEQNPGVDNKRQAFRNPQTELGIPLFTQGTGTLPIYTSKNPILINFCDIDLCGARTKGHSHKLFAHFDYTWTDQENYIPYLGVGGEVEFAHKPCDNSFNNCDSCCSTCEPSCKLCCSPCSPYCACCDNSCCCTCAVSQWGIWLKAGLGF